MNTFEEYLQDKFVGLNEFGGIPITKDNCDDLFEQWLMSLDVMEWLEYGTEYNKDSIIKNIMLQKDEKK